MRTRVAEIRASLAVFEAQRGHLFPWAPVALAVGIGVYFILPGEPGPMVLGALGASALGCFAVGLRWRGPGPVMIAFGLVLAGLCLGALRSQAVSAPVLGYRYYGPVEGRVVKIDRSVSDAARLTLDRVVLRDTAVGRLPGRVRVALHGDAEGFRASPGQLLILTAHLSPPAGPVEPGGFDFRRHAWFQGLGAVGYTRTPVLVLEPAATGGLGLRIYRARMKIAAAVRARMPGEVGAFAAAILTGDRSGIGQDTLTALRASNLAHLLAISGLHMGLLAGVVFAALRLGFAAFPRVGLRVPARRIAAGGALLAAFAYLLMSGMNVATQRAFIMTAVMLIAVMVGRRALSLRAVALAALIVLALRPEALLGPGFQMSFAATTALVAVFGALRRFPQMWLPRWLRPVLAVVVSSAVAGAATAPIAAAHFNQIAQLGLIANLASVPLMGTLVIPAAVLAAVLAPFGLAGIALWLMGLGLAHILRVAHWIAGQDGALTHVISPRAEVLPLLALGALTVILWQGRARWAGILPVVLCFVLWAGSDRPDMLIDDSGRLMGILGPDGRVLSKRKGQGFVARSWLENDGDPALQDVAHQRGGDQLAQGVWAMPFAGRTVWHLTGKRGRARVDLCRAGDWIVTDDVVSAPDGCTVFDPGRLRRTGSLAVRIGAEGPTITAAIPDGAARPWMRPARKPSRRTRAGDGPVLLSKSE